jgi:hypothetical protein
MKPLASSDIWPIAVYEPIREDFRKKVIAEKEHRRIHVGPVATFVFENRLTVKFQIQEIIRAEKVTEPEKVQEEIDGFNTMLPLAGELSATLMIELVGPEDQVKQELSRFVGIKDAVSLRVGDQSVKARFDEGWEDGTRVSAVQYVRFSLGAMASSFATSPVELLIDHPNYRHRTHLSDGARASLAADLATS